MNAIAKKVGATGLPAVNLVPRDIAEKRKMRAVQFTALLAVLIAVGVVAAVYVIALGTKGLADNSLADARAQQAQAIAERDAKAPTYVAFVEQEREEFTLAQIGYGEINYADLETAILSMADDETSFDSLQISGPSAAGFGSISTDPVFGGGVGSFQFTARALSIEGATALLQRIETIPGVAHVEATSEQYSVEGADEYWSVGGAGIITDLRLTQRLIPVGGVTGVSGVTVGGALGGDTAVVPEPEPEASVSPSPTAEEE